MIVALQTLVFFRESLVTALDRLLRPYYSQLTLTFSRNNDEEDEEDEQVFAEFDDEKGVVFFPPVYAQRYAAVSDCLMDERWSGKLEKVADLGYHDMSFIKYLKEVPGVNHILGVDIESIPLRCSSELLGCEDYAPKRESPLQVMLFEGNAADPDYRLIGCDAIVGIEMIEHMLPHDLERLVHTVFGFVKPWIVIFTTPNGDFNALFKALEKNGLRRLDHFFEWSREQFHDWCSNIVARYPQYTVSCKGIGPGPPGTFHFGCCSQLALFVNNQYHKQQDLNINSLALVTDVPSPHNMLDLMAGWESPAIELQESKVLCKHNNNNAESLTEFICTPDQNSCVTIVITSDFSSETLEYKDKTSQCNLEYEIGKNFLMFDDEQMCFSVLVPRRKMDGRVYEIEDVNSRLNCTTCQVKKFSKTTQNLMARNKNDSLVHTREVVNEIRHLTKMLNFNKNYFGHTGDGKHIWYNINWGENAPYWNKYYKIVKEYNYPFETKSDESRILDLISEEINRLIDIQYDEEFTLDVNKLEIPLDHLMRVVSHINADIDKVKDLLEWNGYEIVNGVVIHSRLVGENLSVVSHDDDWPDNETFSDWDVTDAHSTSLSDGSTSVSDYHDRCLRRALDKKVRKLRTMISADEDITTELDRVVCRLMKLALHTSRGKQTPPPARWMQCKLLDLLTLTEKSISRRKKYFIESFPLRAIGFGQNSEKSSGFRRRIKDDTAARDLLERYQHLLQVSEKQVKHSNDLELEDYIRDEEDCTDFEFDETAFFPEQDSPGGRVYKPIKKSNDDDSSLDRSQTWVEEDNNLAIVPYPNLDNKSALISSSDYSTSYGVRYRYKKPHKSYNAYTKNVDASNCKPCKRSYSKLFDNKLHKTLRDDKKVKNSKTNISRKDRYKTTRKNVWNQAKCKPKRKIMEHKQLQSTASKPIPESLIELCHPELIQNNEEDRRHFAPIKKSSKGRHMARNEPSDVAATKESLLVNIIIDDMEETIALRRTIGTDADVEPMVFGEETVIESALNFSKDDSFHNVHQIATENVHSQTIFLYDINEPSTSKGVRHLSTDVQCGPDTITPAYAMLSPVSSVLGPPKMFTSGFKMRDSLTNLVTTENRNDFGTSTNIIETFGPTSPRFKFSNMFKSGIKIKDSSENLTDVKKSANFGSSTTNDYYSVDESLKIGVSANEFIVKKSYDTCTDKDVTITPRVKVKDLKTGAVKKNNNLGTSTDHDDFEIVPSSVKPTKNSKMNISGNLSVGIQHTSKNCDFGSSTEETYRTVTPTPRSFGIKMKDSNTNVDKKKECVSTALIEVISDIQTSYASTTDTKLLKPISSGVIEDSCSEFYGSCSTCSPTRLSNPSKYTSMLRRSKLSCGGVHIHSYKEKQVSEDVVFQGKWQKYKPKSYLRKKAILKKPSDTTVKKIKLSNSKHKIAVSKSEMKSKVEMKPLRKPRMLNAKQDPVKQEQIKKVTLSVVKAIRSNKNITKIASKKAMSSMLSKNTKCTRFVTKPTIVPLTEVNKDVDEQKKQSYRSYLPVYLKKRRPATNKNNLNQSFDSVNINIKVNKKNSKEMIPCLTMSDPEELKSDLIKFSNKPRENVSYIVFRNEIENHNRSATDCLTTESAKKRNPASRRSSSPNSQNSSTCSTPDSVATVRAVTTRSKASTRRHSTSSNKSSLGNTESETTTPVRNRKFTKRGKSTKRCDERDHDKENKPESSKKSNKELSKLDKSVFKGRNKNVYMAQLTNEASPTHNVDLSKNTTQTSNKSNIKIQSIDNKDEVGKKTRPVTATISEKKSTIKSNNSQSDENKINQQTNPGNSNKLHLVNSLKDSTDVQEKPPKTVALDKDVLDVTILDDKLWLDSCSQSTVVSTESSVLTAMRNILEDRLDFIDPSATKIEDMDSDTLNKVIAEFNRQNMDENLSLTSFKTAMTHENNAVISDTEFDLSLTFDTNLEDDSLLSLVDTTPPTNDMDFLSFKSMSSISKYSECYVVDNQPSHETPQTTRAPVVSSVKEIFERREQPTVQQNPPGPLAVQAFSGFSINAASVAGDQPDYVNLVDSETGSIAVEFTRQVTSEEVFVSGRSSDSYGSCVIDEDADIVVPNWLFQIISQQQSVIESDEPLQQQQLLIPMPMPVMLPHEQFDLNGNVTEGLGVQAGAGDGRGMHSDHSQDSSGRGTSLSSSDTSSGQQSEAILLDPSAFTAQFELMHDPIGSSMTVTTLVGPIEAPDNTFRTGEGLSNQNEVSTSRNVARNANPLLVASDVDADVSSLDTDDVPDSSDN